MPDSNICVIIVSYNFEPWIDKCIPSVQRSSAPATILVVDNASADNTRIILKTNYPDVMLIENAENAGFGKANNIGLKYALENNFEYVFLLNQDAWIEPDTLEKLVKASENNTQFGILSPVQMNGRGDKLDFGFSDYTKLKSKQDAENLPDEVTEYPFINAAIWLIPTFILKEIGGFAPLFRHYGEDLNFSQRVHKNGYKIGLVKTATGYHDRESRRVSTEKRFNAEFVYFLTEAVNPNYCQPKACAQSLFASLWKALKALFTGKFNTFSNYVNVFFRLFNETKGIHATRDITAEKGQHYL